MRGMLGHCFLEGVQLFTIGLEHLITDLYY